MGLGLLPWERLPAWLLGPLFVVVGVFLLLHAEPLSWSQIEAIGFIVVGIGVFIHGVKKLLAKPAPEANADEI